MSTPTDRSSRRVYWRYAELLSWLRALAHDHTDLVRIERFGSSHEGRPLYVVIVGVHNDRPRPALWIDANMHSSELIGINVAVNFVDDLVALHKGGNRHGLSAAVAAAAGAGACASAAAGVSLCGADDVARWPRSRFRRRSLRAQLARE